MAGPRERRWVVAAPANSATAQTLATAYALHPIAAALAAQRVAALGLQPHEYEAFFTPCLERLPDPDRLHGIPEATAVLVRLLREQRTIAIFGDYDVDGISGTALLARGLRGFGASVLAVVPNRRDGYGLMPAAVATLVRGGAQAIVTVDNGIAAHAAAEAAAAANIPLIVTDHHSLAPAGLPPAVAHIHPGLGDAHGPWAGISGAGVAFALVISLRRALRAIGWFTERPEPSLIDALQLATLGTIADVVPLVGVNRVIVANGLPRLAASTLPGVAALAAVAGAPKSDWDSDVIAFQLGPRINAAGRIGDAGRALTLLTTDDEAEARRLADQLDRDNRVRQQQEAQVLSASEFNDPAVLAARPLIFAAHPDWNHGVLGIVAGRLARRHHRPTILFGIEGEQAKGSGRSIPEVDLLAAIEPIRALTLSMGGHREAAGITLPVAALGEARRRIEAALTAIGGPGAWLPELRMDSVLPVAELSPELVDDLERLGPFGAGNPRPLFCSDPFAPVRPRLVKGAHVGFDVPTRQGLMSAIAFRQAERFDFLKRRVEVAFRPTRDRFRGGQAVQMVVEDLRPSAL